LHSQIGLVETNTFCFGHFFEALTVFIISGIKVSGFRLFRPLLARRGTKRASEPESGAARQQRPEQAKSTSFDTRNNENGECYKKMTETKSVCFNKPYLAVQKLMCVPYPFWEVGVIFSRCS